jgi:LmbE family N-acetylglucosaminyl deacetylase
MSSLSNDDWWDYELDDERRDEVLAFATTGDSDDYSYLDYNDDGTYEAYRRARGAYDQMWEQWQGNDDYPPAGREEAAHNLEEAYMDWQESLGRGRTLKGLWHTGT